MAEEIIIAISMQIIGTVISVIYCWKSGTFAQACHDSGGFEVATPSDVLFSCVIWEPFWFIYIIMSIDCLVDDIIRKIVQKHESKTQNNDS